MPTFAQKSQDETKICSCDRDLAVLCVFCGILENADGDWKQTDDARLLVKTLTGHRDKFWRPAKPRGDEEVHISSDGPNGHGKLRQVIRLAQLWETGGSRLPLRVANRFWIGNRCLGT